MHRLFLGQVRVANAHHRVAKMKEQSKFTNGRKWKNLNKLRREYTKMRFAFTIIYEEYEKEYRNSGTIQRRKGKEGERKGYTCRRSEMVGL